MPKYSPEEAQFDWALAPGHLLQQELEQRELSQAQLAARTGLSAKHVNLVIKGNAPISADVAVSLEEILGGSAEFWLRAEAAYQAVQARRDRKLKLSEYVDWAKQFPLAELVKHRVVKRTDSMEKVTEKLLRFFQVVSPAAFDKARLEPQASFKRSQLLTISRPNTAVWIRLAEQEAERVLADTRPYDAEKLRAAVPSIVSLTRRDLAEGFRAAQQLLLNAGVVLVFVPHIDQTRISGYSGRFEKHPLIALTGRYKYLDSFWFSLLHEIGHVLLHPKRTTFLELDVATDNLDQLETAANDFASVAVIPKNRCQELVDAATVEAVTMLADELNVAPFMLAGQRAHLTKEWNGINAKLRAREDIDKVLG